MINKLFQSKAGNYSTKRLAGASLILLGMVENFIIFLESLIKDVVNYHSLQSSSQWLIIAGLGALTTTLAEKYIDKK